MLKQKNTKISIIREKMLIKNKYFVLLVDKLLILEYYLAASACFAQVKISTLKEKPKRKKIIKRMKYAQVPT